MKPEDYCKSGTEHAHQTALYMWASQNMHRFPELRWYFSIPNGGQRDKVTAARLKAEGVKSGVSDTMLPVARKGHHGLFIEMKKPGELKGESDKQKEFGAFLAEQGYYYTVCDHWEKARDTIEWYMGAE